VGKRSFIFLSLAFGVLCAPEAGLAATRRLAVVVGNNIGSGARPALRYAEEDATRMGQVLVELGGIDPADLFLLRGRSLAAVQETMQTVERRVKSWGHSSQTVLLFYFSGHSDGQSLEMAQERLPFAELRQWLQRTDADVRLAFVDSCHSGGLLAFKGGTPGPAFDIHLADNMESTGEVLITSSAADESALESGELRGSFFSHHLISGLRGAADMSGDGLVTLSEAYQYAFARTLSATTNNVVGPQHPNYDYRLSGRGEVVLTRIRTPAAVVELPAGFERVLLTDVESDRVIAEIGTQGARRLAVAAGHYEIRAWRQRSLFGVERRVAAGQAVVVQATSLQPWTATWHQAKGDGLVAPAWDSPNRRGWTVAGALGTTRSVADDVGLVSGFLPSLRVSLARERRAWIAAAALELAAFQNQSMRETQAQIGASLGRVFQRGRLKGVLAAEIGGGIAEQRSQTAQHRSSGLLSAAVVAQGLVRVSGRWLATLLVRAPATFMRLDGNDTARFTPAVWAGAVYEW